MWGNSFGLSPIIQIAAVGGTLSSTSPSGDAVDAVLLYDADGGVRHRVDTGSGSIVTTDKTPWADNHPNFTDGVSWHVRLALLSGPSRVIGGGGALGTWYRLDTDRTWVFQWDPGGAGLQIDSTQYTIALSADGGSTVFDSATLTFSATMDFP